MNGLVMNAIALTSMRGRSLFPGVMACGVVAAAAAFLSEHHGAPVMLLPCCWAWR